MLALGAARAAAGTTRAAVEVAIGLAAIRPIAAAALAGLRLALAAFRAPLGSGFAVRFRTV